jgi:hypothetical protein
LKRQGEFIIRYEEQPGFLRVRGKRGEVSVPLGVGIELPSTVKQVERAAPKVQEGDVQFLFSKSRSSKRYCTW